MKRIYLFLAYLLIGTAAFMPLSVHGKSPNVVSTDKTNEDVLAVTKSSDSGIANAQYVGVLEDGTVLGFTLYDGEAIFRGAISTATSITIPSTLFYNNQNYSVTYCSGYDDEEELDFTQAKSVTTLTFPESLINFYPIPETICNLHLQSETPPAFYPYNRSVPILIWVPKEYYFNYKSSDYYRQYYLNDCFYGEYVELHYEGWTPKQLIIDVTTPGMLATEILKQVSDWDEVTELIIKGSLNTEDMKIFSLLTNLKSLDLSQTDITSVGQCEALYFLEKVILPSTVKTIDEYAFYSCVWLSSVNLNNVETINTSAFEKCFRLTSLSMDRVKTIGSSAFSNTELASISLPNTQTIGSYAFQNTKLVSISLPNTQTIGSGAFAGCSQLETVSIPMANSLGSNTFKSCPITHLILSDDLQTIPESCFNGIVFLSNFDWPKSLKLIRNNAFFSVSGDIVIPEGVTSIGYGNFSNALSITIPSSVESLGSTYYGYTIGGSSVMDVYLYHIEPSINIKIDHNLGATLHVPACALVKYKTNKDWSDYANIVPLDEDVDNIHIYNTTTLTDLSGISERANVVIEQSNNSVGHLSVSTSSPWHIGDFLLNSTTEATDVSTILSRNSIEADHVDVNLKVLKNQWNFISFPFDVNVSDIEAPEGVLWVIRKYSGEDRAALSGNTWQNMNSGSILKAGEGYILHCSDGQQNGEKTLQFKIPAVNNTNKNKIFAYQDVVEPLNIYKSEYAHNRNWNLIGNPYPSFFVSKYIDHDGVITVWNGKGYTAYSLQDDNYVLRPNEAFFVQCPENANSITFQKDGRSHDSQGTDISNSVKPRKFAKTINIERKVLNILLGDGEHSDRTRLVINPAAKMDYEISCDASKFLSDNQDVPQIYICDNGIRYAIDERPLGEGIFYLGTHFGQTGSYTIELETNQIGDMNVILYDKETGQQVDLTEHSYTFSASAGSVEDRFVITIGGAATSIKNAEADSQRNSQILYDLNGRRSNGVQKGIYIINENGNTHKILR